MITAIENALKSIIGNVPTLKITNGAGKAFELLVMTGIGEELRKRGCHVSVQRSDGLQILPSHSDRRFCQVGGRPRGVPGANEGPLNTSSIVFVVPTSGKEWEILNGVQFVGRSRAKHELDLAIVPRAVSATLRARHNGGLPGGRPTVSIECKHVAGPGEPDEMRTFVARMYDLTLLGAHTPNKIWHWPKPEQSIYPGVGGHPPYSTYWNGNRETYNALVRTGAFRWGARRMTYYYAIRPHQKLGPGKLELVDFIDEACSWIMVHC